MIKQPQGLKSKSMAPFCCMIKYLVKENVRLKTEVTMAKNCRRGSSCFSLIALIERQTTFFKKEGRYK